MITGEKFRDAVISAAHNVNTNRAAVDALNVFPVPDGDTGTNMSMTIAAAAKELEHLPAGISVSKAADVTASAMLRGARGNSGVILSLIFRGFARGMKGLEEAGPRDLVLALSYGVESAYKAVMKPTEGTILTVVRLATQAGAQYGTDHKECSVPEIMDAIIAGAQAALEDTPNHLPVLKKAGVVDAGGQGLLHVFHGMQSVFKEGKILEDKLDEAVSINVQPFVKKATVAAASDDIKFGYCTEFIVNRNPDCKLEPMALRAFLESIGDSVVCVDDEEIIKIHVHTNHPGNAIEEGLKYGALVKMKIDNMRQQHVNAGKDGSYADVDLEQFHKRPVPVFHSTKEAPVEEPTAPVAAEPVNEVGFVAVAAGEGVQALFREIGVDTMVSGGQTMNPSTEDILNAVEATPARTVFILPNNKNIIMAAEQVDAISSRNVIVLPSRTIPQGITAMLSYDPDATVDENHLAMRKALETVDTAQVTFAARDSSVDGKTIKSGQMLGMENGAITTVDNDMVDTAYRVTKHLCRKHDNASMVTIIYGEGATEEDATKLESMIQNKFSNIDTSIVEGGQPVYHFIIAVE